VANTGGNKLIVVVLKTIIKIVLNRHLLAIPTLLISSPITVLHKRDSALKRGGTSTALLLVLEHWLKEYSHFFKRE
jgi:hypothetical protein